MSWRSNISGTGRRGTSSSWRARASWRSPSTLTGCRSIGSSSCTRGRRCARSTSRPISSFPRTVTLSAARRLRLLDFAQRERVAIVEDDYDHEFHYDGRPIAPLASADPSRVVLYIGSLSKVLAPALRTGYLV